MHFSEINPFIRYARAIPSVDEGISMRMAYDCRFFFCIEGEATLLTRDREYHIVPRTVIYIPTAVSYNFVGKIKAYVLNFDLTRNAAAQTKSRAPMEEDKFCPELIFDTTPPPEELSAPIVLDNAFNMEETFLACTFQMSAKYPSSDAALSGMVKMLLALLLQKKDSAPQKSMELAHKIMAYIRNNYDKPISNSDISEIFNYHSYYLNRVFKDAFGLTIHQALLQERVRMAKHLLSRTPLSIEQITFECGFSDRVQFYTAFRKITGTSPLAYRQNIR